MKMDDFLIWGKRYKEGSCVIGNPAGFEHQFMLAEGVPLLSQWPKDVVCKMSPKYPKDIQLSDNLHGSSYAVISQSLKDRIAALASASKVEFLPVTILNHKGRIASKEYFILNPVGSLNCIDIEKSGVVWNAIDETDISHFDQLVLKNGAVPPDIAIFRPTHRTRTILIRRSVADRISSDGFSGLHFLEPAEFLG